MPTPRKRIPYAVYYNDGSYLVYDLTPEDYSTLSSHLTDHSTFRAVILTIGTLAIGDIRAVIEQKVEKPKQNKGETPDLTPEEVAFLREQSEIKEFAERGFQ